MAYECITAIKDIVVAGAAATAAIMAYRGLNTWRKELKGRSEYQLAKDTLRTIYKIEDAFRSVRNPMIRPFEYPKELTDHTGGLKKEHKHEGTTQVYESRFKKMDQAFIELEENFLDALVEWGPENEEKIDPLRRCRAELIVNLQDLLRRYKYPHEKNWKDTDKRNREDDVIYDISKDGQGFTSEINDAVKIFDSWLRPVIARK